MSTPDAGKFIRERRDVAYRSIQDAIQTAMHRFEQETGLNIIGLNVTIGEYDGPEFGTFVKDVNIRIT